MPGTILDTYYMFWGKLMVLVSLCVEIEVPCEFPYKFVLLANISWALNINKALC